MITNKILLIFLLCKVLSYVCGSDGITYDNECKLRRESCLSNQLISVLHIGKCGIYFILHKIISFKDSN